MGECCKRGFLWGGSPTGKEAKLGPNDTYVAGNSSDHAVLIVADIFGWKLNNVRLIADHFAKEAGATVYVPDYFEGEYATPEAVQAGKFDLQAFIGRNSRAKRYPEIEANAKELKSKYKHVSAIGYCYGAWAVFELAGKGKNLLSSVTAAHPSLVEKADLDNLAVPTLIIAPETDPMFDPLKDYANTTIPKLGIDYQYDFYPGVAHGFATRGDQTNPLQRDSLERAKNSAVAWFVQYSS